MTAITAVVQFLVALAFVTIPMVRSRYGAQAQAAAEAELTRQGVRTTVLADNGIRFDAGGHETIAPVTLALMAAVPACLTLTGGDLGETLSWYLMPLVLLADVGILYSQLTAEKSVTAAFAKKGDPELTRIDVRSLLDTAERAFPSWVFPHLQNARHGVVMGGAVLTLVLLALN
ncbi:hypothetical protein ACFT9I_25235 [Streptomyces sp. NPDC057137]|uniref:hypothetical protein n=1 Tax=Streptomyces sp. NPDC057137 TaxID=3346030 RepID=UPI00363AEA7C